METITRSRAQIEEDKARFLDIQRIAILSGGERFDEEDIKFVRSIQGTLEDENFESDIEAFLGEYELRLAEEEGRT